MKIIPNLPINQQRLIIYLLQAIWQNGRNPQSIYPIFQENLSQFTPEFAETLPKWASANFQQLSSENAYNLATVISFFSDLMLYFPLGERSINMSITRAGYESALTIFTKTNFANEWAEIKINLGIAYEEDSTFDTVQKWENAINCYHNANQIFTKDNYPEKWASIQENLGNAYRNRQQGNQETNLLQAINYYQNALQILSPKYLPEKWGVAKHNLGLAYLQLSILNSPQKDCQEYLEIAIHHFEESLVELKKEIYPDLWALCQMSLGNAYSFKLRANPYENYDKAQKFYENALSIYTPQTNPYYYQQVKNNQVKLEEMRKTTSEEEFNNNYHENSFLIQLLRITLANRGDAQKIFPLLEANLYQLNGQLIKDLKGYYTELRKRNQKEDSLLQPTIIAISLFSNLISIFPQGNRKINLDIAITGWQIVLSFLEHEKDIVTSISINLGNAFYEKYAENWGDLSVNLETAIENFEKAVTIFPEQKALDKEIFAELQDKLGLAYFKRSQIKGNPNDLEKAIKSYKSALNACPENTLTRAMITMRLGNAYCSSQTNPLENLTIGIECYQKSLKICQKDTNPTQWADINLNLGTAYYFKGMLGHSESSQDFEKAIQCDKEALTVYTDQYPQKWSQLQHNLGVYYSDRHLGNIAENLELAISHLNEALKVRTKENYPYQWATTLKDLGVIYSQRIRGDKMTNLTQGKECCKQALEVFTLENNPIDWSKTQHNLGTLYKNLALIKNHNVDDYKKAIFCFKETEKVFQPQTKNWAMAEFELGTCYKNLAVYAKENTKINLAKAIESYQNSLSVNDLKSTPFIWAEITNSLGNAYKHNKQYKEAIKYFEETLKIHTRTAFPTDYIKTRINIGNAHIYNQKLTEAFDCYQEAINTVEQDLLYQLATDDDAKRKLGETYIESYQHMIAVCLKLGKENSEYYATAWEYVERSKARRLVEIFGQTKPNDISDEIWREFMNLRNEITNTEKWIEDREKLIISLEKSLSNQSELINRKNDLSNFKDQLNNKLENYPQLKRTQKIEYTLFSQIGETLSDDKTVIIQWYILESEQKFCAFIYTRQSYQPYVWESSLDDFHNLQKWFKEYFETYNLDFNFNQWIDKLSERLERLGNILNIDDLIKYLPPNCEQVILIPHRYLHLLPIHALPIQSDNANEPKYFFECFTKGVRYVPSCQTLLMLEKRSRPNFNQLFAMGNPTQDRLFTELCVKTVANFWSQQNQQYQPQVLCRENATKKVILNELKDYLQKVHTFLYCGHGSFEIKSPLDSGLRLLDGELLLTEIYGLDLSNCRLVTLIACEAAMTDWTSITDEYIGLASAFLWAGVKGIVSALWTVEEKASVFLGIKFYQILLDQQGEKDVIKALREAQYWLRNVTQDDLFDLIESCNLPSHIEDQFNQFTEQLNDNEKPFSNPYYWAAFCIVGK